MKKEIREQIRMKYGGLCAYTGKPLGDDWQVDHVKPKIEIYWVIMGSITSDDDMQKLLRDGYNDINNLVPCCRIINHYKRGSNLEQFRLYMRDFHKRLAKLPKKTLVPYTARRKAYMMEVAELFDITPDKPFNGLFYFEQLNTETP